MKAFAAKARLIFALCLGCWLHGAVYASAPITLNIDTTTPGYTIPSAFVGISVSSMSIDGDSSYTKFLKTSNPQVVNLFRQIGVTHMRTIMDGASSNSPDPTNAQIDTFFDFAAAAGVSNIIWSLHIYNALAETNSWSNNREVAAHIWNTTTTNGTVERNLLESFAFDNEPDWLSVICCKDPTIKGYSTPSASGGYIGTWRQWCQQINTAGVAPGARFSGPDTGSKWPVGQTTGETDTEINGVPFTLRFAVDAASNISMATQHFYSQTAGTNTALQLAELCLSTNYLGYYALLYSNALAGSTSPAWPKNSTGSPMPYRFTECTAFDNNTNPGNQSFATALWAVDFYHWWAQRGCAGVDPFTRTVQYNSPIYFDGTNYNAVAYAYGMKAFNLGSAGNAINANNFIINNPSNVNLTAYGVVNSNHLYVTVINKTFNSFGSTTAAVNIPAPTGFAVTSAKYIVLSGGSTPGSSGNATQSGACLGGATIPNDGSSWAGVWTNLSVSNGGVSLTVLPTTAVIIDLQTAPAAGAPLIKSASQVSGSIALMWSAVQQRIYQVQFTTNLTIANWTNIGGPITATNTAMTASEPISATSPLFYRVELLPAQ